MLFSEFFRENSLLLWGHFLALLPLFMDDKEHVSRALDTAIAVAISIAMVPDGVIAIGFLSLAYRHLFEEVAGVSRGIGTPGDCPGGSAPGG